MEGSQVSVSAQAPPLSGVVFHNVARSYIPDTRLECHYTLTAQHRWAAKDWIGIFRVGWSSVRDYHTFVWSLAPDSYEEGQAANCCVQFQGMGNTLCCTTLHYTVLYIRNESVNGISLCQPPTFPRPARTPFSSAM
ncbi:CACO1 protein, partial [Polyodon spathula]|nr:CACO1 protein [Polyodon spathula]